MHLNDSKYIELRGVPQFVSIRAEKKDLPLLLYLHGGPGDTALPLVLKYNQKLEESYTVVVWEQRGAGKSYYRFAADEPIGIQTFVDDLHVLVQLLLETYQQEKIYLLGHSWGSVLGLLAVQQFPELIQKYIGCGQVVNMKKSSQLAYEYALQKSRQAGQERIVRKLQRMDCTYQSETWLHDLRFITSQVLKHRGSLYGKRNYNRFVLDFIASPSYGLKDLIHREIGALQALRFFWQELMTVDFEAVHSFSVPVVWIEGKYDFHVSTDLFCAYYEQITSEKALYLFEKSCHFPQWSEPERFCKQLAQLRDS